MNVMVVVLVVSIAVYVPPSSVVPVPLIINVSPVTIYGLYGGTENVRMYPNPPPPPTAPLEIDKAVPLPAPKVVPITLNRLE
jgi:hypothetical protein